MKSCMCENCTMKAKYDANPSGLLSRLWLWHTKWCPGWKKYVSSLPEEKKAEIAARYGA